MWQKQFSARPEPDAPLYVIGDIHGRCDLLIRLLSMIDHDAQSRHLTDHVLVFVGDYIDHGPDSALVLNVLQSLKADSNRRVITLRGNHDEMLLRYLDAPAKGKHWIEQGGHTTLDSFGISGLTATSSQDEISTAHDRLGQNIGDTVRHFLEGLETSFKSGNIFVSHAGADPAKAVDAQTDKHLVWGAPNFLKKKRRDKTWVAHGHFATEVPHFDDGRINVDTGAYRTGHLTAARILTDEIKFMTAELNT